MNKVQIEITAFAALRRKEALYVDYINDFLATSEADKLLAEFLALDMTPETVVMYGKEHVTKRRSIQYGVQYNYNEGAKIAIPWTPLMLDLKRRMEILAGTLDGGLVQIYPDGESGIGWHEDKGEPAVIASLSLGAERAFAFGTGPVKSCVEIWRMTLDHGSLLLIPRETNLALKHRLCVTKKVKEPRVNVTLRRFDGEKSNV